MRAAGLTDPARCRGRHVSWMDKRLNLIIFHQPKAQKASDFETIRDIIAPQAPDIEVHIITPQNANSDLFWRRTAEHRTLIFSPTGVRLADQMRGTRLINQPTTKEREARMVHKAGYPVPQTARLVPELVLDEKMWGPFAVVKPNIGSNGRGVRLRRTRHVHWADPMSWPEDDYRRGKQLIVQQYVHSGDNVNCYRVLAVLGEVIYSIHTSLRAPLVLPDPRGTDDVDQPIAANTGDREVKLNYDEEVLAFAQGLARKLPMIPVMPIDVVRHRDSGQLFVMEINSHGWSWHLSSPFGEKQQAAYGLDYYRQFNGLEKIAKALIDKTRQLAS